MKKQIIAAILIVSTCLSSFVKAEEVAWPSKPDLENTNYAVLYSLASFVFWNSETSLQQNFGLHSNLCTYTSNRTKKTFKYKKIGACAFEVAKDKLLSDEKLNSIFIWANNDKNEEIVFKLDWEPKLTSFFAVLKQAGELQFEGAFRLLQKIGYTPTYEDSIVGDIKLTFKNDDQNQAALRNLLTDLLPSRFEFLSSPASAADIMSQVQEVGIKFSFDKDQQRDTEKYLLQNIKVDVVLSNYVLHFKGRSNINPLKETRSFSLDAQLNVERRGQ